jgi:hypothetical protein
MRLLAIRLPSSFSALRAGCLAKTPRLLKKQRTLPRPKQIGLTTSLFSLVAEEQEYIVPSAVRQSQGGRFLDFQQTLLTQSDAADHFDELFVRFEFHQIVNQLLHRVDRMHSRQRTAEHGHGM